MTGSCRIWYFNFSWQYKYPVTNLVQGILTGSSMYNRCCVVEAKYCATEDTGASLKDQEPMVVHLSEYFVLYSVLDRSLFETVQP
jgi:hypothetical protein